MSLAFVVLTKCHGVVPAGKMFELTDSMGKKLFETIAISLVCDVCMKTDHPERQVTAQCPDSLLAPIVLPSEDCKAYCRAPRIINF